MKNSIGILMVLAVYPITSQVVPPLVMLHRDVTSHVSWTASVLPALPPLHEALFNVTSRAVSEKCSQDLIAYSTGLANRNIWALTMFDASTKLPESIVSGSWLHLGNFDQCLSVQPPQFPVQYCGFKLDMKQVDFALSLQIASCLPATCSPPEIQEALTTVLTPIFETLQVQITVTVAASDCYTGNDRPSLDAAAGVMISVFCLLGLMVVVGSTYDYLSAKKQSSELSTVGSVLVAFSLFRNFRSLMSTRHAPGSITCLHGLRVLSLYWIILGHRFAFNLQWPLINPLDFFNSFHKPMYSLLVNSYVAVDTFFFISGFLVSYVFFIRESKAFNVLKFYLYRYIRLTTCLALLVGYYVTLLRYTGYGPRWRASTDWQMEHCDKYWWLNLLYLNNYIRFDHNSWDPLHPSADCVDQGWYLTVDMQLAWLAPLVLLPLLKWPRITSLIVLPLLTLISCFTPFTSTYINEFPMTTDLRSTPGQVRKFTTDMYWPTHMRATPYIVGLSLAYFMYKTRDMKINIPKWVVGVAWLVCTGVSLTIVFATAIMYDPEHEYNRVEAAFFAGFHRLGWSLALSWIVFACSRGYAGVVNWILSWRVLLPFSKLSYCMFITHFIVLYFDVGQMRTYAYYNSYSCTMDFFSDLWMTGIILGLPLHLCCEAPTLRLLNIFFRKGKTTQVAMPAETLVGKNTEPSKLI